MPHIRFKAVPASVVQELSSELPVKLAEVLQTTEDNFSFELVQSVFFEAGKQAPFYPYIEFAWFDRGQKVQDQVASIITEAVQKKLNAEYVAVVFIDLPKTAYYENGRHFGG